jgi:hypothetical protein
LRGGPGESFTKNSPGSPLKLPSQPPIRAVWGEPAHPEVAFQK